MVCMATGFVVLWTMVVALETPGNWVIEVADGGGRLIRD